MNTWDKLKPALVEANQLLIKSFPKYVGNDPFGQFDVSNKDKVTLISVSEILGSFNAWKDEIFLNLDEDPLGTAVHELLHANSFSDDWHIPDPNNPEYIVSFRGLEFQWITADHSTVKAVYHRALNEAVTELFTIHIYKDAIPAYENLIPFAQRLVKAIEFDNLAKQYFCEGYPGLEEVCSTYSFNLRDLDNHAESIFLLEYN
ncbi:MAG TPA: hypothetical protein VJK03_01855 [Candidatus Nanoarchaeia archaeon]|nr:hypothetical protein [Candidatus Nanoarchaeia archaeon]